MAWDTIVKVKTKGKAVEMLINENGGKAELWESLFIMTKETARELSEMLKAAANEPE